MLRLLILSLSSILPAIYAHKVHVGNKPQVRVTTALVNFHARIMDQWGDGGDKAWTIANDSYHPFAHRQFGGGKRREIRGTNMFGSGYPYGAWNTTSIARRSFPFGVWPLYWEDDFMDSSEVGAQLDTIRPGGHISIVPLRTTKENFTISQDEVYYAVGDSQSLISILISYVTWCHASLAWPTRFDPTSPNATVKLENVLQYYRASSFALASPAYSNPNSRNASYQPTGEWIPEKIKNSPFWQCLDSTTASALPVLNPPPKEFRDDIIIIVLTSLWMVALAVPALILYVIGWCCFKCRDFIWDELERTAQLSKERVERMENLEYEQYP